jgi:hypothetical protein
VKVERGYWIKENASNEVPGTHEGTALYAELYNKMLCQPKKMLDHVEKCSSCP